MSKIDLLILVFTFGISAIGYSIWLLIEHSLSLISKKSLDK